MALAAESISAVVTRREAEDFSSFVDSRRDRAIRLAFRLLGGDQASAEDVVQNAFLRAYRALGCFRGESSMDTWFYRIVVREVHRYRRWQAIRRLWSADPAAMSEAADEQPEGDPVLRRRIASALERLSRSQRDAFVLVHLEGFSVSEAASALGKAEGTVKSHLHRALGSLRRDLKDVIDDRPEPSRKEEADAAHG
ncbi:MAG: RNA polymerase sigma factor [Candidatus Binatia bacterium]